MKNYQIISAVALAFMLAFTGCTKEEEPNHFRYTVNDYPLFQGFIHNYGMPEGATGFNFDVTLFSEGVSYNRDLHEFRGKGHVLFFQFYSSSATELANGMYQLNSGKTPSTLDVANFGMHMDFENETGTIVTGVSGSVKVSGSATSREFDFEFITGTGEMITGHFNRTLPVYDMRDLRKQSRTGF